MEKMKYLFGDTVVIETNLIGVVVKTWDSRTAKTKKPGYYYEVYVRNFNSIVEYHENDIERYQVRHKELDEQELEWQNSN